MLSRLLRVVLLVLSVLAVSGCATNLECDGHACVGDWKRDMALGGTVVRCADGTWSHAGGLGGVCAGDGGLRRAGSRAARQHRPAAG